MAPGKKNQKDTHVLMELMPIESKEIETEVKECSVCVIREEATIGQNRIVINLDKKTTLMKLYKIVAEKANYIVDSFMLSFLKPASDGKSEEEIVLTDSCETTLKKVIGDVRSKTNNFILKGKNGKNPLRRIQQATENADENDSLEIGVKSLFEKEISFPNAISDPSKDASFTRAESGFVGLINQAMTCYLNSLLQSLFMTPEFRNALYRWKFTGTDEEASKSIPFQLQKLFLKLQTSKKKAVETTDLTKSFGWDSSEAWQQHDVQELCRVMFDALEETLKNTDQANLINQLYQGEIKDYVKCLKCSSESARNDTYLDIPLAIRPFGAKESYHSIEEAFMAFTMPEVLDGNNQYFCEKCDSKQDAHKGLKFLTFPNCLTIQLKRFSYDYNTGQRIKLHDRVTFPEMIKMNEFIHNDKPKSVHSQKNASSFKQSLTNGDGKEHCNIKNDFEQNGWYRNCKHDKEQLSDTYELFSIMIHSGNALGGHYYAYIKSFANNKWYCFNDQHVYEISKEEIEKSYGGLDTSSRGYYSATYSSSTNAYMLMYRKKDAKQNIEFCGPSQWPEHVISLHKKLIDEESDEIDKKSKDKDVCKIRLFCEHPKTGKLMETKLHVEQSKSLKEATEIAWKLLDLQHLVGLERCRLVKYDDNYGSYERSFEGEENKEIGLLLGGVKYSYAFDLLLEMKDENQQFPVYESGGTTIRVFNVDLRKTEVEDPIVLHVKREYTLLNLKQAIKERLHLSTKIMRVAVVKDYQNFRLLTDDNKTLKSEGFYKSAKVFIEASGGPDSQKQFKESDFAKFLDTYSNTIRLIVVLPLTEDNSKEPEEIIVKIDKRKTLGDFKEQVAERIGVAADYFRVYRVYSNSQEFEVIRLKDQLNSYCDETKMVIKLGRALKSGESRIKIYLLRPNEEEHTKFLMEAVVSDEFKVKDIKKDILIELKNSFQIEAISERIRLRKKSWKNPSIIYMDESQFEKDIRLTSNTELFVEIINENQQKMSQDTLTLYVRHWRPSEYEIGLFEEVVLKERSLECLKSKLSELSEIPKVNIEIAKGKGNFPYASSVLDIDNELEWDPSIKTLNEYPLAITDDGSVIYYKDRTEILGDLGEDRKKEIMEKEGRRLQKNNVPSSSRKEKALKIYTNKS